jgi:hypothetical protein
VTEVAAEKNSTLVMPIPVELLRFFDKMTPTSGDEGLKKLIESGNKAVAVAEEQLGSVAAAGIAVPGVNAPGPQPRELSAAELAATAPASEAAAAEPEPAGLTPEANAGSNAATASTAGASTANGNEAAAPAEEADKAES